jgi:VanZ family protein
MALLLILIGEVFRQYIVTMLFIGFISAVMDETIQIFSSRGSQVIDVWFDFFGLLLGMCTMLILRGLWRLHLRKRKYENKRLQVTKKNTCEKCNAYKMDRNIDKSGS